MIQSSHRSCQKTTPKLCPTKPFRKQDVISGQSLNHNPLYKIWSRATMMAERTPTSRNRYVDCLRAVSIIVVVLGHWLVVAPYVEAGEFVPGDILSRAPWTQWLSWLFQVMPIFFIVGGYANSASWLAAERKQLPYRVWLTSRLQRLVTPLLPLILIWAGIATIAYALGVSADLVKVSSRFALLPTWFLMVYIIVVMLVPLTYNAWRRFGLWSFWAGVTGAVVVDLLFFATGSQELSWLNYGFIWLSIHQLGYGWQNGQLTGPRQGLVWATGSLLGLICLVTVGPYPISMVSVPGEAISNTVPPKLPLLALGTFQAGLLLSFEPLVRRWLAHRRLWTGVILVNSMIMTIYLWHVTALTLLTGTALALGGFGLGPTPGSTIWWLSRPIWLSILTGVLLLFMTTFARFEHPAVTTVILTPIRLIAGSILICVSLAALAFGGIGPGGLLGLQNWVLLLPFFGAALLRINPLQRAT